MMQGVGSATLAQSVATISAAPAPRTWPIVEGPDTPKISLAPGDGGAPLAAVMQPQAAETAPGRGGRGGGYGGFLPPKAEAAPVAPAAAPGGRGGNPAASYERIKQLGVTHLVGVPFGGGWTEENIRRAIQTAKDRSEEHTSELQSLRHLV